MIKDEKHQEALSNLTRALSGKGAGAKEE